MVLWDEVGGRTWIERAGLRAAIEEADARPRRRSRLRRLRASRSRPTFPGPQAVMTPGCRAPEGPR